MTDLPILYRVAEGGPFDIQVDNGVTIENITDDLVNAKILIPDGHLQALADAWQAYRRAYARAPFSPETGQTWDVLESKFNALTGENNDG